MVASGSLNNLFEDNIYISHKTNNYLLDRFLERLKINNNIIETSDVEKELIKLSNLEINNNLYLIMNKSKFILIILTDDSIKSFIQALEIDCALNFATKILYINTSEFKHKHCLPFYDETDFNDLIKIINK